MKEQRKLKRGDLIWADRSAKPFGLPYNHCGIYEGGGSVIHFAPPEGCEIKSKNAVVHQTSFEQFKDRCPVKVIKIEGSYDREKTVRRALGCLGMRGYSFFLSNCDHFATWCKTGEYRSIQIDAAKAILKDEGGSTGELICGIHDIAETIFAPRTKAVYPSQEIKILDIIETNALIDETIPPVPDDENDIQTDYLIMSDDEVDTNKEKIPWYERVGNTLKGLTYPVAGALEFLKNAGKLPPIFKNVEFVPLGAKVRNVIDNVVTKIKLFTGRITPEDAYQERMNNETALAGSIIGNKLTYSVGKVLRHVFGKVGSVVKHVVQQAVTRVLPPRVRTAIKTSVQTVGKTLVNVVKSAAQKVGQAVQRVKSRIKSIFS